MIMESTLGRKKTERRTFWLLMPRVQGKGEQKAEQVAQKHVEKGEKQREPHDAHLEAAAAPTWMRGVASAPRAEDLLRCGFHFARPRRGKPVLQEECADGRGPARLVFFSPALFDRRDQVIDLSEDTVFFLSISGRSQILSSRANSLYWAFRL